MLRPPQALIAALVGTTVVITGALVWTGWRLHHQQRAIDEQQSRDRLETAADAIASGITGRLAETGDRLSVWLSSPNTPLPAGTGEATVALGPGAGTATPPGLPFLPAVDPPRPVPAVLEAIERLEFGAGTREAAVDRYRRLAVSPDPNVRAETLARLCRALRSLRDFDAALACARQLASLGAVRAGPLPAELAGLEAERLARRATGDRAGERRVADRMRDGIDAGRWMLPRGAAEFYREETGGPATSSAWTLARALSDVWDQAGSPPPPQGRRMVEAGGRRVLVMWRAAERRAALVAAFEEQVFSRQTAGFEWHLSDPDGRVIAGTPAPGARSAIRIVGGASDPWTLRVVEAGRPAAAAGVSRAMLPAMTTATLCFVWAASYFMCRAIRREAKVARLQSDFVSAVSHEFRSPLTTIRQMAEMLETERVPGAERRAMYYRMIAGEAGRLQHLVETLLNFGKMQEGAARYQHAEIEAGVVAAAAACDVAAQAASRGTRIVVSGETDRTPVRGDETALRLAVSNLVDNAVKYSPAQSTVRIASRIEDGRAVITVTDSGPGIPLSEQPDIFRRFVRGRAAIEANIKGTGVGLALVQEIVRAHGGEIRLDSYPGRGSVFTILLPLDERRLAAEGPAPAATGAAS